MNKRIHLYNVRLLLIYQALTFGQVHTRMNTSWKELAFYANNIYFLIVNANIDRPEGITQLLDLQGVAID